MWLKLGLKATADSDAGIVQEYLTAAWVRANIVQVVLIKCAEKKSLVKVMIDIQANCRRKAK